MKLTIEKLKGVLCDPEGRLAIGGTEGDLQVVDECMKELEDHEESLRTVRNSLELKSQTAALRLKRIERLEQHVEKLKQLLLLTDPAVHDVTMNDLTQRQWAEYQKWCDE